uniref:Uncharacterized protein n=1 Tax=Angiostrongylus cantonensis TaxID=6313 RepID=A0A0K0CVS9_ANGCA
MKNGNIPNATTGYGGLPKTLYVGGEGDNGIAKGTTLTFALMELCLCVMVRQVPLLCSTEGRLIILPGILYLIIGFIRESSRLDENSVLPDLPVGHLTTVATASLQALRNLASSPPTDSTLSRWITIMQCALFSLLQLCDGEYHKDECVLMLSCVVLASVAPSQVVLGHRESVYRFVRLIRSQLQSEHAHNISEEKLQVLQDALKTLEITVTVADGKRKFALISLFIQSLCRLLCANSADEWRLLSQPSRRVHEFAIQRLNAIAPLWPVEFKQVLECHPLLKKQLESALLFQSSRQVQVQQHAKAKAVTAESKVRNYSV